MSSSADSVPSGEIRDIRLVDALSDRYLSYALSTIMSRSLPDVRDGLKPVHRRLLFAMRQLKLDPGSGYKKSARVVGDVIGKFHPHGDQSIYDALVRLAQEFSLRYPLIDGQGNFGNIDGDNAAAMRYTEARLTDVAGELLRGIDEDTVEMRPTYDGEAEEPCVLPSAFPNLLANGSQGIAVGMATSIPPHNVGEICDALLYMIKVPNVGFEKLVDFIPGPDFPTGGILVEGRDSILQTYSTGRGSFRVRARWETEDLKGGLYQIVITEIPFQVQKSKLIEKIAELINNKKLFLLNDVRDESAEDIRVVLEPKSRNVDPAVLMESLFKQTELEARASLNMNVLDADQTPRVMNLKEVLQAFLDHRHEMLVRSSRFRLGKIANRLEVLEGYLIAYLNLDEVIRIIREEDKAKQALIARFKLTDVQAEAILNMRLRALRKLEEIAIRDEHAALTAEKLDLEDILAREERRWEIVSDQIKDLRKAYGQKTELGRRRTDISDMPDDVVVPLEAVIEREPLTILCSEKGWIRAMKGHQEDTGEAKYKEGDSGRFFIHAQTTDRLLIFASNGRFYTLGADKLPGGRGFGEPLRLMLELPNDEDIVDILVYRPDQMLLLASSDGRGFQISENDVIAQTRTGKQILNLGEGAQAMICYQIGEKDDMVAVIGENRKLLVFKLEELPEMARGRGVIFQKYRDGGLSDIKTFRSGTEKGEGLTWTDTSGRTWTRTEIIDWLGRRASAGRLPPTGFPRNNKFG
ncbi:DNA topoisomerase IV subunit A [Kiloniella laminariae]|uniref:DNA topoisomerase 4 subunit A n=1 Tax=Kiloniella laminariae TaxID=454162 RepID=A0ABT4LGE9_9PROT|nr:DNA topoisomerase IV subunit A [Kiloniella laminariae]MCZ4280177.1 DNA topoisomerase IV subunit A [Kiloniella laminariae]